MRLLLLGFLIATVCGDGQVGLGFPGAFADLSRWIANQRQERTAGKESQDISGKQFFSGRQNQKATAKPLPKVVCNAATHILNVETGTCESLPHVSPLFNCPPGCQPSANQNMCDCIEEASPTRGCPDGFRLENPKFRSLARVKSSRPSAVSTSGQDYLCIRRKTIAPLLICPVDYKLFDNTCIQRQKSPATPQCPFAGRWDVYLETCIKEETSEPELRCPDGYGVNEDKDGNAICVSRTSTPGIPKCPAEYRLVENSVCRQEHLEIPSLDCPLGYQIDLSAPGSCVKEIPSIASKRCPDGFRLLGHDSCERVHYLPGVPRCRIGFEFDVQENACIRILREDPELVCSEPGYRFDGRLCTKSELTSVSLQCSERGSVLRGDECIFMESTAGSMRCSSADAVYEPVLHRCIIINDLLSTIECPGQSILSGQSRCTEVLGDTHTMSCEPGWVYNGGLKICSRETLYEPNYRCESGRLYDRICEVELVEQPKKTCSSGSTMLEETCVIEEISESVQRCPVGFLVYDDKCIHQYSVSGLLSCPSGSRMIGDTCVGSVASLPEYYLSAFPP